MVVRPSKDVKGEWESHCLDLDVVSQGRDLAHALEMVEEAAQMVLTDDLAANRDPSERCAPTKYWRELWAMLPKSQQVAEIPKNQDDIDALITKTIFLVPKRVDSEQVDESELSRLPVVWMHSHL